MTAVEQLIELLAHNDIIDHKALNSNERLYKLYIILVKQAKEMEKKQIIDAYHTNPQEAKWKNIGINYYNETYVSNHIVDTNEMIDHIGDANKMVEAEEKPMRYHCVPKEISDKEIEQYAEQKAFNYYEFVRGAKWYREQLNKKEL